MVTQNSAWKQVCGYVPVSLLKGSKYASMTATYNGGVKIGSASGANVSWGYPYSGGTFTYEDILNIDPEADGKNLYLQAAEFQGNGLGPNASYTLQIFF